MAAKDWKKQTVEEVTAVIKNRNVKNKYPYIEIGDIDVYSKRYYVKDKTSPDNSIKINDIFISKVRPTRGAISILKQKEAYVSPAFTVLRGIKVDKKFLFYLLSKDSFFQYLGVHETGTTYPSVNDKTIQHFKIYIPKSEPEQSKIAEVLSKVDQAIEQTESLIAKQQRVKTGLMQDLLTRGIDEHGNLRSEETHEFKDSPLGRIPVEWGVCYLDDCVPTFAPICYGILMPGYGHVGGVPVIKVKDIVGGRINQNDLLLTDPKVDALYSRSRLKHGDLLLTIRGTTGRLAIVPLELEGANITQDTARIRLKDGYSNYLFYFLLQTQYLQDQINLHTLGQAVKGINIGEVKRLHFGLPKKQEQFEIAERMIASQSLVDDSEYQLKKLRSLKTALMQDLLSGKVRVTSLLKNTETIN